MVKKKEIKLDNFSADQQKELNQIVDQLAESIEETLVDKIAEASGNKAEYDVLEDSKLLKKDNKNLEVFSKLWKTGGQLGSTGKKISLEDLFEKDKEVTRKMKDMFSTDHPLLLPRVISNIAREAIEPNLVLTPMLSRINYSAGTQLTFPSWGAIHAADIPEGGEYPERTMELSGQVNATIGKSGVAIKVSEEMIRYSQFDIIGLHVRAAGRAMARWKEKKAADMITSDQGNIIIDNTDAAVRSSTGRGVNGQYNGTLTLDDLFYCYAQMISRGFTPNTLIMNPFAWQIFAEESISRAFGFTNGMSPLLWQAANGAPGNAPGWAAGGLNQNTYVSAPQQLATTFTNVPSIFPTNFRIVVSPYMPYNTTTTATTIVMCDAAELGLLVVDEEIVTDEWEDKARDIRKIKFRERYAITGVNDGKGIGILKGVKTAKSVDFVDRIRVSYATGDFAGTNALGTETGFKGVV